MLNILSVDFDFFQLTDIEKITRCYPDAHDVSTELSRVMWSMHYVLTGDKLNAILTKEAMLEQLIKIINKSNKKTPVMVVNSHIHIYDFIKENIDVNEPMLITNIDMHHDCFNKHSLDCGNWVHHVKKDFHDCKVNWIADSISQDAYGVAPDGVFNDISYDFDKIKDAKFDAIFICRSDGWTPPHLDSHFDTLFKSVAQRFRKNKVEQSVMKPREMDEIVRKDKQMRQSMLKDIGELQ